MATKFINDDLLKFSTFALAISVMIDEGKWISEYGANVSMSSGDYLKFSLSYTDEADKRTNMSVQVSYPKWRHMIEAFEEMDKRTKDAYFYITHEEAVEEAKLTHENNPDSKGFNPDKVEYGWYLDPHVKPSNKEYTRFESTSGKTFGMRPVITTAKDGDENDIGDYTPGVRLAISDDVSTDLTLDQYEAISYLVQITNLHSASRSVLATYEAYKAGGGNKRVSTGFITKCKPKKRGTTEPKTTPRKRLIKK